MPRPVFADPKTDYVFHRLFGTEEHKDLIIALLNHLLELDEAHRILDVTLLERNQRPSIAEIRHSIAGVRCRDARGVTYVVEMQVLNVEGFEKHHVHDVPKTFEAIGPGRRHPEPNDVIGVTICDFEIWPRKDGFAVPMLSRWRMREEKRQEIGRDAVDLVFLELSKLEGRRPPQTGAEKWAYFFHLPPDVTRVPEVLAQPPFSDALEATRIGKFTHEEWEEYLQAEIALQDERGRLSLALRQGREAGRREGREEEARNGIFTVLAARGIDVSERVRDVIEATADTTLLHAWVGRAAVAATAEDVIAEPSRGQ